MTTSDTQLDASEVIDELGGTAETARLCEVSPAAVSQWRLNGMPKSQLKYLRLAKPEIFIDLEHKRRSADATA